MRSAQSDYFATYPAQHNQLYVVGLRWASLSVARKTTSCWSALCLRMHSKTCVAHSHHTSVCFRYSASAFSSNLPPPPPPPPPPPHDGTKQRVSSLCDVRRVDYNRRLNFRTLLPRERQLLTRTWAHLLYYTRTAHTRARVQYPVSYPLTRRSRCHASWS